MPMEYGTLRGVDKPISRLVQGTIPLSDNDPEGSFALLDGVYEAGGRAFDTAHSYGNGMNETMLGKWIVSRGVRDDVVVLFHGTYGFQEVGQQRMGKDGPQVSLLALDLPSYAYVRETWLDKGGLPDVPWLTERSVPSLTATSAHDSAGKQHP